MFHLKVISAGTTDLEWAFKGSAKEFRVSKHELVDLPLFALAEDGEVAMLSGVKDTDTHKWSDYP